jgi:hypothetical protein
MAAFPYLDYHEASAPMPMHNPPHLGGIVCRQRLDPLRLSAAEVAERLGVMRTPGKLRLLRTRERPRLAPWASST